MEALAWQKPVYIAYTNEFSLPCAISVRSSNYKYQKKKKIVHQNFKPTATKKKGRYPTGFLISSFLFASWEKKNDAETNNY